MFLFKFFISDNADHSETFAWTDKSGQPISLAGSTLLMHIKRTANDAEPLLEMSSANQLAVIDSISPHQFTLTFPRNSLRPQDDKPYVGDLLRITAGKRERLAKVEVSVERGPTR